MLLTEKKRYLILISLVCDVIRTAVCFDNTSFWHMQKEFNRTTHNFAVKSVLILHVTLNSLMTFAFWIGYLKWTPFCKILIVSAIFSFLPKMKYENKIKSE